MQRHYYRLALTSDPSYAAYFGTANVLAEKVTLINRVNQIYNDDLATELRLVNDDRQAQPRHRRQGDRRRRPLRRGAVLRAVRRQRHAGRRHRRHDGDIDYCDVPTLGKNRTVLGQLVGASNYDVGHIALGNNGGGIAYLGVVGGDYKGGGCTGLPEPKGDFFAIDYVAHEIGHQFAGNHTFNGALGACGGNISEASVEPGSGSSVMAYAGICGQDDLQPHTDPYFSFRTIDEVDAYRADTYDNIEVQTVSLTEAFGAGDSLVLGFDGSTTTVPFADYNTAGLSTRPSRASPVGRRLHRAVGLRRVRLLRRSTTCLRRSPTRRGFQVIFNDEPSIIAGAGDVLGVDVDGADRRARARRGPDSSARPPGRAGPERRHPAAAGRHGPVADNTAPVVDAPAHKTDPGPHAVRAHRVSGHRRRRRRPRLPLGADQLRRRAPACPTTPRSTARCSASSATTPWSATRTR